MLGCTSTQLGDSENTCTNSPYVSWLVNGQYWWTRTSGTYYTDLWLVLESGTIYYRPSNSSATGDQFGIRPVITVSKDLLA